MDYLGMALMRFPCSLWYYLFTFAEGYTIIKLEADIQNLLL